MSVFSVRFIFASLILCFFSHIIFAQKIHKDYRDGLIWVNLKNTHTFDNIHHKKPLLQSDIQDLKKVLRLSGFQIVKIDNPFRASRSAEVRNTLEIQFSPASAVNQIIRHLEQNPMVGYAERVPLLRTTLTPNDLGPASGTNNQYGLWKISAQEAWDLHTGNASTKVAIVDDAVLISHPDLQANVWVNPGEIPGNNIDDDMNGYVDDVNGYDVADNDNTVLPNTNDMSHGTHVAGIVGARTNNGVGVASIGYGISIMAVKSSNQATVVTAGYAGVVYATEAGADVINMSWGGGGTSNTALNIINAAYNAGVFLVAAAGNDNVETVFYPAGYANVLAVASTNSTDVKSDFSNYGTWVNVSAPGSSIRSTYINSNSGAGNYASLSGTSMASPMVAGLAGLMRSYNPNLSNVQIKNCLLSTADNIYGISGNASFAGKLGTGRINAFAAMQCVQATLNQPPVSVVASNMSVICPNGSIQFFGASSAGPANTYQWIFNGGVPATSNLQNPIVSFPNLGQYTVKLITSNTFGVDTVEMTDYVNVSAAGIETIFEENWEASPNPNAWLVSNPDNATTWAVATNIGGNTPGNKAAFMNHFSYTATGQRDRLISPTLDFSTHANHTLSFEHAYRRKTQGSSDSLIIYASADDGVTWSRLFQRGENGTGIFATTNISTTNFVPNASTQWCFTDDTPGCFSLSLNAFDGSSTVRIAFESYNSNGNNLYVDNIKITGNCTAFNLNGPIANIYQTQSTICPGNAITFRDSSANFPSQHQWIFEGGVPATSSSFEQTVVYPAAGTYFVKLITSNVNGTDSVFVQSAVVVNPKPNVQVNPSVISICEGESIALNASGATTYTWSPTVGISSSTGASIFAGPQQSVNYQVIGVANGCSDTATAQVDVSAAPAIASITFDGTQLNSNVQSGSFQWYLDGQPISGATNSTHIPLSNGMYSVEVTGSNGCKAKSNNFFFGTFSIENQEFINVMIYPNPASELLTIEGLSSNKFYGVSLLSLDGKTIFESRMKAENSITNLSLPALANGIYFVRISNGTNFKTIKVLVQQTN